MMDNYLDLLLFKYIFVSFLLLAFGCKEVTMPEDIPPPPPEIVDEVMAGVDLSFFSQMEDAGVVYMNEAGNARDLLELLKERGVEVVRLRLWHSPEGDYSSLEDVEAMADRLRDQEIKVWLTVHYSDTWADPGQQTKPAAWDQISFAALKDSVYTYTQTIIHQIQPDIFQVGNEINNGFLHPDGHRFEAPAQFKELLAAGIDAARQSDNVPDLMLHFAGYEGAMDFYQEMEGLDYDYIGLSYYPRWHGKDLDQLKNTMVELKETFQKEVWIAEVSYPFTLDWNDWTHNAIGLEEQIILPEFPATPNGQKDFMQGIRSILRESEAAGFCYWGAEWVAFDGPTSTEGSGWENQTLFDFDHKLLPVISAFAK